MPVNQTKKRTDAGRRWAVISVACSTVLAILNTTAGILSHSTSVTAAGVEFAGDVLASFIVFLGMVMASRPADEDHPYGHGRFEILAGLLVGLILLLAGTGICIHSLSELPHHRPIPSFGGIWAPVISIVIKAGLAISMFRVGRAIGSGALIADAWNNAVDILSAATAVVALLLTVSDPAQFANADAYGAFAVGIIVVVTG